MTSVERLADVERRLAAAEDQLAIYRLLMAYGDGWKSCRRVSWLPDGSDASHRHMRAGRSAAGAVPGTEPGR